MPVTQEVEPDDASEGPGVLLGREFATAIVVFHEAVGRLLGLSSVERKCLDLLQRLGPVPTGAIGEHTGLTTGAVTGLVDRLERAGYIRRAPDAHDRRKVVVALVPNERMDALMRRAFEPFIEDLTAISATFSAAEQRAIGDWVGRATEVLVTNTRRVMGLDGE